MIRSGELIRHVAASLRRVVIGFSLAAVVAIPLGLSIGGWPRWGRQAITVLDVLRPVPPFVWIPFALLWFGVGDLETLFVIFITSAFPIVTNTVAGIEAVDPIHYRSALCLGASRIRLFRYVVLPSALPQIMIGLRTGLGFAWMVLVGAELIGSTSGLGYLILDSRNLGLPALACLGMCVIGLIGYALDSTIRQIERKLLPWAS
jgi:NitT/TauT family transport system permease protein